MLNKSGKGVVYFRIKDSGDIFGLTIGKKALADITHKIQNNLKPLPNNLQIEPMRMEEKQVIRILAQGKRILEGER